MSSELIFILSFVAFIFLMMAADLGLFGNSNKAVSLSRAGIMSAVWVALALAFYALLYNYGHLLHHVDSFGVLQKVNEENQHSLKLNPADFAGGLQQYRKNLSIEFITGYVVEYALSVDNIFVIVLIFTAFGVDKRQYHKVLLWGIIGAVLMRFLFIFVGATLISRFHWVLYIFGAFLVYTGVMLFVNRNQEDKIDTQKHPVVKFASRFFAVHPQFVGGKFFVKENGKRLITPLLLVLLIIEFTDLIFAVDSIPAIFSVTKDPYIVFFSNIFAIMGLRSMFFLLVNIIDKFHFLKIGLSALLTFIGLKMLAGHYAEAIGITTFNSLLIILGILVTSVIASLVFPKKVTPAR
jgi:tellurite resistance protein TerC